MGRVKQQTGGRMVFSVKDMPHYAPYLQFLLNILQIHFAHVEAGGPDYGISDAVDRQELEKLYNYLYQLREGEPVDIRESDARVLYATFVIVSRLLICDYGERVCQRLIQNLASGHRWHEFEIFRNDLLRHNTQMLLDMDQNMDHLIRGLDTVKARLELIHL